jgi:transcriptional regulator with XRE-family HTH domain
MTGGPLAVWRQQRGLTVREVGEELGVSQRTAFRLLSGNVRIPLPIARVVWALGCIDILQYRLARYEGPPRDMSAAERDRLSKAITGTPL